MAEKRLLKIKAQLKKRQPKFIRQDAHKRKKLSKKWRAPTGLHSKMRDGKRGYRAKLQEGYRTPKAVRGMTKAGLLPTVVATAKQLAALDPKVHAVVLSGTLGGRKRLALIEQAQQKGFTLQNASAKTVERIKAKAQERQDARKQREAKKAKETEKAAPAKKTATKTESTTESAE